MDAFVTRTSRKRKPSPEMELATPANETQEESTDLKLAILSSLHPYIDQETLLDILLAHDGNVEATSTTLNTRQLITKKPPPSTIVTSQTSLRSFTTNTTTNSDSSPPSKKIKPLKGQTLHLYDPKDVADHTSCILILNFLPQKESNSLLLELLEESKTFTQTTFKLFDNIVSSPHTSAFYVSTQTELQEQKNEYVYNGAKITDVRTLTPFLTQILPLVQQTVNHQLQTQNQPTTTTTTTTTQKQHHSPSWIPNAALVNHYSGPSQSVGYHTDQLTYLGPFPTIASLSLGVTREFRLRRILSKLPHLGPQIAIHLPHNSLLIMLPSTQENWKHSVVPTKTITPHPISGNSRINITYRHYREKFHPRYTPRCSGCNVPCVLRVATKSVENWGKYLWMCYAGNVPGKQGCDYFKWAQFDDDGNPVSSSSGT
ncbi:alpha-ketoglutarate-dependent dioxygenase alkB 3 [Podospora fimiseda]|uniref:Alpha-ketoglutarate-dependent dioxygenase alkB 3 n=1 Tax=Podospora fimiseda TaxID=252190 RepID=A0AAN7H173_9PEZI|nr:alpha-ketoglutarate-dependent dioxygenase alkB 3 [Podospora fimiseda]